MKKRNGEKLPLNRIKKIMQANKEIGKIQQPTPQLIAWALETFIDDITNKSYHLALKNKDNKITPSHLKEVVLREPKSFSFLKQNLTGIPDLVLIHP